VNNPKVFEFAKEVGMTPLALMDKIREWQLPVKSHMAELDDTTIQLIRTRLKGVGEEVVVEKKTAVRKKPTAVAAKAKENTIVTTRSSVKVTEASDVKVAAPAKPSSSSVVRRKKATDVEVPSSASNSAGLSVSQNSNQTAYQTPATELVSKAKSKSDLIAEAEKIFKPVVSEPAEALEQETQKTKINEKHQDLKKPEQAESKVVFSNASTVVSSAGEDVEKKPAVHSRKKEVAIGQSGVMSSAPKRNIIGRMDLGRVPQQNQNGSASGRPERGSYSGGGGSGSGGYTPRTQTGPGGFRPKGNLRAGFVAASTPIPIVDTSSNFSRKKDDKKRNKSGVSADGTVAPKAPDENENQHFDAAEFRKREMVFQPKKKKDSFNRPALQTQITTPKASKRVIKVNKLMKVNDLANNLGIKVTELIKVLMKNGVTASINTDLDFDTIALIVPEFNFEAVNAYKTAEEIIAERTKDEDKENLIIRPPVVTVMGHVDHGKTSLLDAIRNAQVAAGEAGGITQHIGAYQVSLEDNYLITFLDTPGHEAFTAMRARGANVTDIAVIVVAADDGVMPQTAEAINHAKAAGVPIIVAVNKMDKPGANPEKVKQQLTEYEIVPEEWGGTTIFAPVSAIKKTGIKELLEHIKLVAEVGELKANPERPGTGIVIESKLDKGRGSVATILVKDGTVKVGQYIVAGTVKGKVRNLSNYKGERVDKATPGMPVELLGLEAVPAAGDKFDVVPDEKTALEAIQARKDLIAKTENASSKMSLEELFARVNKGDVLELPVVLKSDVAGSLEAIQGMFAKLTTPEVKIKVIHSGIGGITESDVLLASTAKGIIVGFNVRPDGGASNQAKRSNIEIRTYSIVYELMDDMKKAMTGMLAPTIVEKAAARVEVRNVFTVPKVGAIAGSFVLDGKVLRSNLVRLVRDGKIIYEGKISSLKRFKDDVKEVQQGFECGIGIENFNDVKVGDIIEAYTKEEIARELTK